MRAAQLGRALVLDEADKAPLEASLRGFSGLENRDFGIENMDFTSKNGGLTMKNRDLTMKNESWER